MFCFCIGSCCTSFHNKQIKSECVIKIFLDAILSCLCNCTQGLGEYWMNIHQVYAGVRWNTDWISIGCMQQSGGYWMDIHCGLADTDQIFIVCTQGSGKWMDTHWVYAVVWQILIKYSLHVCRGQADTEWISIECMQESGGYQLDIHWYMQWSGRYWLHIHWVYAGVQRILNGYLLSVRRGQADTD